jgi:hypothetical protein
MVSVAFKKLPCLSVALLAVALCNGCAGLQPAMPVTTIGTLRPTFEWTYMKEPGISYELIICAGIYDRHGFWVPGKTAYYREGITTTRHTIDQPLSPDTVYVWSVRARLGKETSRWTAYNDRDPKLIQKRWSRYNIMCPFKTPIN